jgi:hypothetical protein
MASNGRVAQPRIPGRTLDEPQATARKSSAESSLQTRTVGTREPNSYDETGLTTPSGEVACRAARARHPRTGGI